MLGGSSGGGAGPKKWPCEELGERLRAGRYSPRAGQADGGWAIAQADNQMSRRNAKRNSGIIAAIFN